MEIHKPKAARSIREFLVEIGTITIGILIALSLEAGIQAYHNHRTVEHARADLRRELKDDREILGRTISQGQGGMRSIDTLTAYGKARLAGHPSTLPAGLSLSTTFGMMSTAAWDSTVATQALSHMPYAEAQALSRAYSGSTGYNEFERQAVQHWFELSALPDDPTRMSRDELKAAMRELALNRGYQASLAQAGTELMKSYDAALAAIGPD